MLSFIPLLACSGIATVAVLITRYTSFRSPLYREANRIADIFTAAAVVILLIALLRWLS